MSGAPPASAAIPPLALLIQPACLEHKYIRHANSSHIFERPERLRAVLLGFAAALARLEAEDASNGASAVQAGGGDDDLSSMLSSLSIQGSTSAFLPPPFISLPAPPPAPITPGQVLLHHPALQLAHSEPIEAPFPYLPRGTSGTALPSSKYLRDLYKWASEAVEMIRTTGCEIPRDPELGLNAGDLYLGPGSILAIEGAVQTVCQAVDGVCTARVPSAVNGAGSVDSSTFAKAFCAIRPPGHHCGEDAPSGFCYVNNVVVGAMHAYLEHDIDRAIIIDFDLHHGNGTQALVMPLNSASNLEDLANAAGKPKSTMRGRDGPRRGWKGFYGSVHDIYSYPCEDGDLDLIKDASVSLAGHGQYIENVHLQPYKSEADFYERIYPLYLALLDKALVYMRETDADPERTVLFISAGFDACEHEHQGMQRHDRRVPVSFYSRYTKDLAAFADKYTGGKVISVLEGGYGDRALTSAALGHAIGMLGREGQPEWWSIDELELLERAVKKRRKGKLCQLGAELAAKPHIARTHALLAHFEGAAPSQTPAPSANATPQQPRRTLRERRPKVYDEDASPVPATRRLRKPANSTTQTPVDTPRRKTVESETPKRPEVKVVAVEIPEVKAEPVPVSAVPPSADALAADLANVSLAYPSPAASASSPPEETKETKVEPEPRSTQQSSPASLPFPPADPPRIMLRIPRLTPPVEAPAVPQPRDAPPVSQAAASFTVPSQPSASAAPAAVAAPAATPPVAAPPRPPVAAPPAASASETRSPLPIQPESNPEARGSFRPGVLETVALPPTPHARVLHTVEWEQTIDVSQLPQFNPSYSGNAQAGRAEPYYQQQYQHIPQQQIPIPPQLPYMAVYPTLPKQPVQVPVGHDGAEASSRSQGDDGSNGQ